MSSHVSRRSGAFLFIALLMAVVGLAACGRDNGLPQGSALVEPPPGLAGFGPIPPGQQVESLDVELENRRSSQPVTLLGVDVRGRGVGTVGRIVRMEAAPVPNQEVGSYWVPDGEWVTYPPVAFFRHRCRVQRLLPMHGYVLQPTARIRVAMTLEGVRVGTFKFTGVQVRYSLNGVEYVQTVRIGVTFSVRKGAKRRWISPGERPCLSHTTVLPRG